MKEKIIKILEAHTIQSMTLGRDIIFESEFEDIAEEIIPLKNLGESSSRLSAVVRSGERKLISLEDHDKHHSIRSMKTADKPKLNGIACPICGKELYDTCPNVTLTSYPPKKSIHCDCGWYGFRLC